MSEPEQLPGDVLEAWWEQTGRAELRQLLHWRWDPIGVEDFFPESVDEYDHYLDGLMQRLWSDADAPTRRLDAELYLRKVAEDDMGLTDSDPARHAKVADLAIEWYDRSLRFWRDRGGWR